MRAIRYDRYGPPEVLRPVDVPEPVAQRGQVLVRVHAAGVHPVELHARTGKLRRVLPGRLPRGLGADVALDYRTTEVAGLGTFDVVLDLVGTDVGAYRRVVKPGGRLIALALDPDHLVRSVVSTLRPGIVTFTNNPGTAELTALTRAVDDGLLRPVVAEVLAMEEAAQAHRRLESGGVAGRIVLDLRLDMEKK